MKLGYMLYIYAEFYFELSSSYESENESYQQSPKKTKNNGDTKGNINTLVT